MQLIPSGRSQHSELPNDVKRRACWMTTTSPTPTSTRWLALQAIMWLMISCRPGQQSRRACWPQGLGQLKATLRVAACPALQRPVKKTIYKRKPKTINVDKNYSEAIQKSINGLPGIRSYKPAGILTDASRSE